MRLVVACLLALALGGCGAGSIPDPNDPAEPGANKLAIVRSNLRAAAVALNERKAKGQVDDEQYRGLIANVARRLLKDAGIEQVPEGRAWELGEVLVTAQMWREAEPVLETAVRNAEGVRHQKFDILGRWVTDLLRLARVKAELGKVHEAAALTRKVYEVPPKAKVPILPAVLYEIVPAGQGKGWDEALARLLEEAIGQHAEAIVDPNTEPGRAFLLARPHHIRRAWATAILLYRAAGRPELALQAARRAAVQSGSIRL